MSHIQKRLVKHADYLKKHRCPKCGEFALKTKSLEI